MENTIQEMQTRPTDKETILAVSEVVGTLNVAIEQTIGRRLTIHEIAIVIAPLFDSFPADNLPRAMRIIGELIPGLR